MPAISDHDGPDGAPLALFESGAILQYLARKTGKFYGTTYRDQLAVDQWLMWQMGGLGPMAGAKSSLQQIRHAYGRRFNLRKRSVHPRNHPPLKGAQNAAGTE
jgi:glutathione S-transferase